MLRIDFINVGSGDAALLRVNDYAALVDCGNTDLGDCREGSKRISAADFLRAEGVSRLDLVILTHLHRDHIGGFQKVAEAVPVKEVWTNYLPAWQFWSCRPEFPESYPKKARGLGKSLSVYLPALQAAERQGTAFREITHPIQATLAEGLSLQLDCLEQEYYRAQSKALDQALLGSPDPDLLADAGARLNETSLRLRLTYFGHSVLLPGDCCGSRLAPDAAPCTVFKVPHHGSAEALDRALAMRLSPAVSVISCGAYRTDNRPDPHVVRWLREASRAVLCTDACEVPGLSGANHSAVTVLLHKDGTLHSIPES